MRRSMWSTMCLVAMLCLGLATPSVMADRGKHRDKYEDDDRLSVSVAFGLGLNTAQPGNPVNHVILPNKIKIKQDGVVHFLVAGFHQIVVYKPGTKPEDIDVPDTGTFIDDQNNLFYKGIKPAGGPPPGTPPTPTLGPPRDDTSNAMNRVESVGFPAEEGVSPTTGAILSAKAEPGVYLVICNVRGHFLDGMFAFVKVKAEDDDD
jgi:hypothetical protein